MQFNIEKYGISVVYDHTVKSLGIGYCTYYIYVSGER